MYMLIAGATGVGKTTFALALALRLDCQVISTSAVRTILRRTTSVEASPELFLSTYRLSELDTALPIRELFVRQARMVSQATVAVVQRHQLSRCLIEGVHRLPLTC